jgi:hypothetical protein
MGNELDMANGTEKPPIYLRNNFVVKPGRNRQFFIGKANLIGATLGKWSLVAACGDRPMILGRGSPEPSLPMMQIWRLEEWNTLYDTIFNVSETGWYRQLGDALSQERQEFLVGVTSGFALSPRPAWSNDSDPGYSYVYEEVLPLPGMSQMYLRQLNWFTSTLRTLGQNWQWLWSATQVTAGPSVICSLWKVPFNASFADAEETILASKYPFHVDRYGQMTDLIGSVIRRVPQYPIYTERLDYRIHGYEKVDEIIEGLKSAKGGLDNGRARPAG